MNEFFQFLFKGKYSVENFDFFGNLKFILTGYFKLLFSYIILVVIFSCLGFMESKSSPSLKNENIPLYFKLLFICIISPIFEEMVFRLPLNINKTNLFISVFCLNLVVYLMFEKYVIDLYFFKYLLYFTLLVASIGILYFKIDFVVKFLKMNFVGYLHLLTVVFCLIHYGNFNFKINSAAPYLLMFLMLINGYYYAYTRLRFGFFYSISIHAFHNILISLPLLIKIIK